MESGIVVRRYIRAPEFPRGKRPTEWLAQWFMNNRFIPSSAYKASTGNDRKAYQSKEFADYVAMNISDGWAYRPVMKLCNSCGNEYPENDFFWPVNRDGRNGLYSQCRGCKREVDMQRKRRKRAGRRLPA